MFKGSTTPIIDLFNLTDEHMEIRYDYIFNSKRGNLKVVAFKMRFCAT